MIPQIGEVAPDYLRLIDRCYTPVGRNRLPRNHPRRGTTVDNVVCTLLRGHGGLYHVAHGSDGTVLAYCDYDGLPEGF